MDKKYNTLGDFLQAKLDEADRRDALALARRREAEQRLTRELQELHAANERLRIHIEELRLQRQSRESGNFPRPMSHAPQSSEFSSSYVPEWAEPLD